MIRCCAAFFSILMCPLWRSLRHLSCSLGRMYSCGLSGVHCQSIIHLGLPKLLAYLGCLMISCRPTVEDESVDGVVDGISFCGS